MTFTRTLIAAALIASGSAALAQANIHQDSATAGNVTPGDAPGFPITISQPGSYRLTSNLFVPSGKSGIVITAPDVTLDLNGFTLSGTVACTQNYSSKAITCTGVVAGSTHGITTGARSVIKNGTVKGFSQHGVFAMGGAETIERVTAVHNGANGIHQETWTGLRIADSLMILNRYNGAETRHSLITGSRFISNGNRGLHGREEVTLVLDSVAFDNADIGIFGTTANRTIANGNPLNVGAQFSLGVKMNKQGNYIAY